MCISERSFKLVSVIFNVLVASLCCFLTFIFYEYGACVLGLGQISSFFSVICNDRR